MTEGELKALLLPIARRQEARDRREARIRALSAELEGLYAEQKAERGIDDFYETRPALQRLVDELKPLV